MKNIADFKVILWDFDGVIMDSMAIRSKGFEEVLKDYSTEEVSELMTFHELNGGLSRYVKFRYFFENIRGESITDAQVLGYAEQFSKIMFNLLLDEKLLIQDSLDFIKKNHQNFNMHIVSGSDGNELKAICDGVNISQYFKTISGSPINKTTLINHIFIEYEYNCNEVMLIGDSINDFEAAKSNNIEFFGYNNKKLLELSNKYIESFADIFLQEKKNSYGTKK